MTALVATAQVPRPEEALSVVVIPLLGGASLTVCLTALQRQPAKEILVVAKEGFDTSAAVRLLVAPLGSNVPERRMTGLNATTAPYVAFIEDTCVPQPNWTAALCEAFTASDVLAVGGPVRISASLVPRLRALAIGEYGRFSGAGLGGRAEVDAVAGVNFAIRRAALAAASLPNGLVDNLVFDAVRRAGGRTVFNPSAGVTYAAGPPEQARLTTRFHHGRIYGGLFAAQHPLPSRVVLALTALATPAVLIARNLRDVGPQLLYSPSTLGWTVLMQCAWGCGEVMGKLTGSVGASLKGWA